MIPTATLGLRKMVAAVMAVSVMGRVMLMNHDRRLVTDAKVVPYETVATQHLPLICTLKLAPPRLRQVERCGPARINGGGWKRRSQLVAGILANGYLC
ncbi:unnamed protein product [Heligmosomoides polygyrus]|uniref:Secreted protein n=1 Tax=Heligmosomoides polygyrus TaxID=6339 RepID=A0A183GDZ2_HELPZ|nr:unnamed protein product [Heligmosomoides polygyrus]